MPDCSYVTLTVAAEHATDVEAILVEAEMEPSMIHDDPDEREFEWDEAAWGASYLTGSNYQTDESDVTTKLRERQIPYVIQDGGHYTWDPYEIAWRPGMENPRLRYTDQDGNPILTAVQWRAAVAASSVEDSFSAKGLADLLHLHFGDDPKGWI